MTDVWKIGQDRKANEYYEISPYLNGCIWGGNEVMKANNLTKICNEMAKTYDQIIEDQNEYLVDINASLEEISELETDLEARIEQLEKEIEELLKKNENGTITEEEKLELESKTVELNDLETNGELQINEKQNDLTKTTDKAQEADRRTKSEIATDYGETAIEKGQPLSETKDKGKSFWRKLSGSWNKQAERDAGKNLLESGNNLLEQVDTSAEIDNEITKKTKSAV